MPTLDFWRQVALQCMGNTIGTYPGDVGRPMRSYRRPQILEYNLDKVPNYRGKWLASGGGKQKYQKQCCKNQLDQDLLHRQQINVSVLWMLLI